MEKQIEINGINYIINYNALAYIEHTKLFNRGVFEDVDIVDNFVTKQTLQTANIKSKFPEISEETIVDQISRFMRNDIDAFIQAVTRLTYTGIRCVNRNFKSYEEWLMDIKEIRTNDKWIVEVTKLVVSSFC